MKTRTHSPSDLHRKPRILPLALALLLFALFTAISAVGQTFSGLNGTVLDASKASVKGAKVTATNTATGVARVATTSPSGFYSFPDLLEGFYSVRVQATGFQSEVEPSVKLDAAAVATVNFALHAGDVNVSVDVSAVGVELDRTTTDIADTFSAKQIQNIPINDRDYIRFVQETPGAVIHTSNTVDLSFDGLSSRVNYYYIDGVDLTQGAVSVPPNGLNRGPRLLTGSQEMIAEFRVQTNGYQPEYGRAAGGVVNIVTKAGTSKFHGEGFEYFRNEALDARNFFARVTSNPSKPRFRYNDFGGNIGGPIGHGKTFFFFNYEGDRQQLGTTVGGTVLSSTARAQALSAHPELAPLINDEPIGVDLSPTSQTASYTVTGTNHVQENTFMGRVDHTFNDRDSLFGRYIFDQANLYGPLFINNTTSFGPNQHQTEQSGVTNIAIHEQHIFSSKLINDFLAGYQRYANNNNQNQVAPYTGDPYVSITGLNIITGSEGVSTSEANLYQYGDAVTYVVRNHTLKFGSTFYRLQDNNKSVIGNDPIDLSEVFYTSINSFINNQVSQVSLIAGDPGHLTLTSEISSYAQDSWQLRPNLVLNYGVRSDIETTPHDKNYATQAYNPLTGTLFAPGHEFYNIDFNTFGPRAGISYSPTPRIVVRAGSGVYFNNELVTYTQNVYANTLAGNNVLTAAQNPGLKYPFTSFTNGTTPIPTVYGFPANKRNPFTTQYNVSVARDLGRGFSAQVAYVGLTGANFDRPYDHNVFAKGASVRPNPNFSSIYEYQNDGSSNYNALQVMVKGHLKHLTLDANYTWSHSIDDVADLNIAQGSGGGEPQDYNNIAAERGHSGGDQPESFNYTVVYDLPVGAGYRFLGGAPTPVRTAVSGWSVDSLGVFNDGSFYNVTQGINTYGNSDLQGQRPDVVPGVSKYLNKTINPTTGFISYWNVNAWQKPNTYSAAIPGSGAFGNSPRNPVMTPHLTNVDFALRKNTPIHNDQNLEFRAEFFNIFNHPNFAAPAAVFAPGSTSFGIITTTFGNAIGLGGARQLQLALKYKF
jgi:outer membrane receptor protein involved in Fe transport